MFSSRSIGIAASLGLSLLLIGPAHAQIFIASDQTLSADVTGQEVFVGKNNGVAFATLPTTPHITLTVGAGAVINSAGNVYPDGKTYSGLNVFGTHEASIIGGAVDSLSTYNSSLATVTGGSITDAFITQTSTVTLNGGTITNLGGYNSAHINITGGETAYLNARDNVVVSVSGGNLTNLVFSGNNAVTTITGGTAKFVYATETGTVVIQGGSVFRAETFQNGTSTISGGTLGAWRGNGNGVTTLNGGTITGEMTAYDSSTLNIAGNGLTVVAGALRGSYHSGNNYLARNYAVTGTLTSGDVINNSITASNTNASISENAVQLRGTGLNIAPDLFVTTDTGISGVYNKVTVGKDSSGTILTSPDVTLDSGLDAGNILVYNGSQVTVTGGIVRGGITANDTSLVHLNGGSVTDLTGKGNSVFEIVGANFSNGTIRALSNSVVDIYGVGLTFALTGTGSDSNGNYTAYTLSGILQNRQSLNGVRFLDYSGGLAIGDPTLGMLNSGNLRFLAITAPEPTAFALFGFALPLCGIVRRQRRRID